MSVRPFTDTLTNLRFGRLHDELSDALNALVAACVETQKVGTLTVTLKLKPSKGGAIEILDEVKVKTPEFERGSSLMFPTPENNLVRSDPRQQELEGLRTVEQSPSELRKVGA
jgi:hypothetical protein